MVGQRVKDKERLHLLHLKVLVRAAYSSFEVMDIYQLPKCFDLCIYKGEKKYTIKVGEVTKSYEIGVRRSVPGLWCDEKIVGVYDIRDKRQLTNMVNDTLAVQKWAQEGIASFYDG